MINLNEQTQETSRTSMNILDVLGNCGGIKEILVSIFAFIFEPISLHAFNMTAIMAFFKIR